jgi:hypothetical protein
MDFLNNLFISIEDSFLDSWTSFPILLILYFTLEWFGHYKGFNIFDKVNTKKFYSPVIGALLGIIPQCGIGILMTGLYLRGAITTGTILSIYIATSDEALLVILSDIHNTVYIIPIIIVKFITASIFGIIIDTVFKIPSPKLKEKYVNKTEVIPVKIEPHHSAAKHDWHPMKYKSLLWHAFKHSFNIYIYIFALSIILTFSFNYIDIAFIPSTLSKYQFFEIVGSTLVGLVPNCIASVAIAQAFLHSSLSFGAMIAGLSSAAGLGLLLLIKEAKIKDSMKIIFILVIFSICLGFAANLTYPLRLPPSNLENYHDR